MTQATSVQSSVPRLPEGFVQTASAVVGLVDQTIQRWRDGEPPDARAFLDQHPHIKADKHLATDLIYEEFCLAVEAGKQPTYDNYYERFPSYRLQLRRVFDAQRQAQEHLAPYATVAVPGQGEESPNGEKVPWPALNETFAGFLLVRELGRGAFARVYLASEPALGGRLVAVKVSRCGALEAHTLGKLNHANIVPVFSVQKDAATQLTIICMPYLGSATLCDVLVGALGQQRSPVRADVILEAAEDTALPPDIVIDRPRPPAILRKGSYIDGIIHIGVQLAAALDSVHRMGVCHRDLKPSNVLMMPDGTPMLLDFNLSSDTRVGSNRPGGTLPYMSPEQLLATDFDGELAQSPTLDARSDLYSLGVILYELLTGRHPLGSIPKQQDLKKLRSALLERHPLGIVPIRRVNPRVDRSLARVIERCLAPRPADRPQTAAELAAALRKCLAPAQRLRRYAGMHPWRATAAALILTTATSLLGGYGAVAIAARDDRPAAVRAQEAYGRRQFDQAIEFFDEAIKANPNSAELSYGLGRAWLQRGENSAVQMGRPYYALALEAFAKASDKGMDSPQLAACKGHCLIRLGEPGALTFYEQAIKDGFATGKMLNNAGYIYVQKGKFDEADGMLKQAIEQDPVLQAAFHNRAMLNYYRVLNKTDQLPEAAIGDILRALELGRPNAELHHDAAQLYALAARGDAKKAAGRNKAALDQLAKAIDQGHDPQNIKNNKAFRFLPGDAFQELVNRPSPQNGPAPTHRIVDPILDLPGL